MGSSQFKICIRRIWQGEYCPVRAAQGREDTSFARCDGKPYQRRAFVCKGNFGQSKSDAGTPGQICRANEIFRIRARFEEYRNRPRGRKSFYARMKQSVESGKVEDLEAKRSVLGVDLGVDKDKTIENLKRL